MIYNEREIYERTKLRKKNFFLRLTVSLLLTLTDVLILLFFSEKTVVFFCVLFIIALAVFIIKTLLRYDIKVLFSSEIQGINIKEHEFLVTDRRVFRMGSNNPHLSRKRLKTSEFVGGKRRTKPPTSAIVYLRLSDGSVTFIDGLSNAQTDVYEIGDALYKYPGTKYPIILKREVSSQPCPLCGTANKRGETECITCNLKIDY